MELPYLVDEYLLKIREIQNQELNTTTLAMHLFFLLLKSRKRYQNNYQSGPRCYFNVHAATAQDYMITYPYILFPLGKNANANVFLESQSKESDFILQPIGKTAS